MMGPTAMHAIRLSTPSSRKPMLTSPGIAVTQNVGPRLSAGFHNDKYVIRMSGTRLAPCPVGPRTGVIHTAITLRSRPLSGTLDFRNYLSHGKSSRFLTPCRLAGLTCASKDGTAGMEADRVRWRRILVQLIAPVALGLVIGLVLAFQAGSSNSGVYQVALGTLVSPSPSASIPATTTTTPATTNVNCDIIVPANPLSARGLATPYQLTGTDGRTPAESGGRMSDAVKLGAFVQATILDPATGALSVYDPLVVTQGTRPAVRPSVPTIPANAVVTIDFGFNGKDLFQVGATPTTLADANCVNGQAGSVFGQVSFCNGISFFDAVKKAEREGLL